MDSAQGEGESADRVLWVELSVRGDLWEKNSSKSKTDFCELCYDVWLEDTVRVANLSWFGHVQIDILDKRMIKIELPGTK